MAQTGRTVGAWLGPGNPRRPQIITALPQYGNQAHWIGGLLFGLVSIKSAAVIKSPVRVERIAMHHSSDPSPCTQSKDQDPATLSLPPLLCSYYTAPSYPIPSTKDYQICLGFSLFNRDSLPMTYQPINPMSVLHKFDKRSI